MQLANEDNLRLNVLLAQPLRAVRIDESRMEVLALTAKGVAKVMLSPTVREEQYLRWVKELLATKATGSPAGYPVFMKRWTRIGQINNNLRQLLLLGEPEAIIAISHAPGMNYDIAECAWWANPCNEVAMGLLQYPEVVNSDLGREMAAQLMEFLPFEEKPVNIVQMVRLCLQGDLLTVSQCEQLWRRAKRRHPFYVGFAFAEASTIPLESAVHADYPAVAEAIKTLSDGNNTWANLLCYLLSKDGQSWLRLIAISLEKPVDPDVVVALFTAIDQGFRAPKPDRGLREITEAQQQVTQWLEGGTSNAELSAVIALLPAQYIPLLEAALVLSQLGENTLNPIFGGNDSVGTVMRKRLQPLFDPMLEKLAILTGSARTTIHSGVPRRG